MQTELATQCTICLDDFNKTIRKKIVCESCNAEICMKCIKRFFAENVQEPNCMQCREVYTKDFLDRNFSKHYRRVVIKNVRATSLTQREQQYLPGLMHRAEAYKKSQKIKEQISILYQEKWQINNSLFNIQKMMTDIKSSNQALELCNLNEEHSQLNVEYREINTKIQTLTKQQEAYEKVYHNGSSVNVYRRVKCITLNCKGYLDNSFNCSLCDTQVCEHCQEQKTTDHTCNQNVIENIKAIQNETKPCPSCNTNIFRSFGCSQMFCTLCHTVFDWETGMIDRGRVHNPHYFEWRRGRNIIAPREIGDFPCGGLPSFVKLEKNMFTLNVPLGNIVYVKIILNLLKTIERKEIPKYPVIHGRNPDLDKYSVDFLADLITESKWKGKLIEIEKRKTFNTEQRLLFDTLMAVMIDNMNKIKTITAAQEVDNILTEINEFREYYNKCVESLARRYEYPYVKTIPYDWSKLVLYKQSDIAP
jgi:hypothetical protein